MVDSLARQALREIGYNQLDFNRVCDYEHHDPECLVIVVL